MLQYQILSNSYQKSGLTSCTASLRGRAGRWTGWELVSSAGFRNLLLYLCVGWSRCGPSLPPRVSLCIVWVGHPASVFSDHHGITNLMRGEMSNTDLSSWRRPYSSPKDAIHSFLISSFFGIIYSAARDLHTRQAGIFIYLKCFANLSIHCLIYLKYSIRKLSTVSLD